jgi:predicted O-methyltransferase YrrM
VSSQTFIDADLYPFPKIHIGPALDTLKKLTPPGSVEKQPDAGYDLVFIDADKERIHEYFQESLRLTRKGGLIVVDNAVRGGRIAREQVQGDLDVTGLRKFYDWIEQDRGETVLASGIQTVGAKVWE